MDFMAVRNDGGNFVSGDKRVAIINILWPKISWPLMISISVHNIITNMNLFK